MNWKPTNGKKPDLPDNQIVQSIAYDGFVYVGAVDGGNDDWKNVAFYRESPIIKNDDDFAPIINNQLPNEVHDKDEIEVIDSTGESGSIKASDIRGWQSRLYKFYRLIKKYEEPKPTRVGELMTYDEWFDDPRTKGVVHAGLNYCGHLSQEFLAEYMVYVNGEIENDR